MTSTPPSLRDDIRRLLHPRSVAVIGASNDASKWGGRFMGYVRKHPPPGPLYPINPRETEVFGQRAYARVSDCPGPVDMAILMLPHHLCEAALLDCAAKGVHSVVTLSAGYAEAGGQGRVDQDRMVEIARGAGMRIVGPNCVGLLNTHHELVANTTIVMGNDGELPKGPIGLVTQSGALMGTMLARGVDMGVGFSVMVSVGNQADLDINDFFDYLVGDPLTEVICLYIEQVPDARRFLRLLAESREAGKPVLLLKAGRTAAGAEAVNSHTASLAGPFAVFEAACRAQGSYLFDTVFDMLHAAALLVRKVVLASDRIAVMSGSGGGNALLVDQIEEAGLRLATLTEASREALVPHLGAAGATLPADLASVSAHAVTHSPLGHIVDTVMDDPQVGAGVMFMTTQPNAAFVARTLCASIQRSGKPLLFVQGASSAAQDARDVFRQEGCAYFESTHDAIAVLEALARQRSYPPDDTPRPPGQAPALPAGYLHEAATRELLAAHGIASSEWQLSTAPADACATAAKIGYPVVLKGVSSVLVHKSDHGLVKVNLRSEADLLRAFGEIEAAVARAGAPFEGVLVTRMVPVELELIAGVKVDPEFGPMVLIGAGGVLVEVLKDTQLAAAPLSLPQARALVQGLRCAPLLQGYRGIRPLAQDALEHFLVRLSMLAWSLRDQLLELDINPLALSDGELVVLDARATTRAR